MIRVLGPWLVGAAALVALPASAQTAVTNTATVTLPAGMTCPAPVGGVCTWSASDTDQVVGPGLALAKTASAASFTVGVPASYTLTLANGGTAATTAAATVTDTVPAGLQLGALPGACSAAGQTVSCTVPAGLAANGGQVQFVLPVMPLASAVPSVANTASVSGGGDAGCPAAARCSSTATVPVGTSADLSVTKTVDIANPAIGQNVRFTVTVANAGPSAAAGVSVNEALPSGYTLVSATAGVGTYAAPTWNVGALASGASATLTLVATVRPAGDYGNTAIVSASTPDPNSGNNHATATPVPQVTVDAVDDNFSAAPVAGRSGGSTASVIGNDSTNGVPAVVNGNVSLNPGVAGTPPASGSITMTGDGRIVVAPQTTAGTYTLPYQLCTLPAASPAVCDGATATVRVAAALIDAVADSGSVANGALGGLAVADVLANDPLDASPATLGTVTLAQVSATHPGVTLNTSTGAVYVAAGTPAGGYALVYRICERLNPANCDTATVTVTVAASATIDARDDNYSATPVNGGNGGTLPTVVSNDTVNGGTSAVVGSNVSLTPGTVTTPPATGSVTMNPDGTLTVAAGTSAGTYSVPYQICTLPPAVPPVCGTAAATAVVVVPPVIAPQPDSASTPAVTPVITPVLANDGHTGGTIAPASVTVTVPSAQGGTSVNPATGAITFTPNVGFSGLTTYTYQVCLAAPNAATCGTAVVTVNVGAVIQAVDDHFASPPIPGRAGGTTPNVLGNDTSNGVPAVLGSNVSLQPGATPAGIVFNAGGTLTVAPGTVAGTYAVPYRICTVPVVIPAACDDATVTVVVAATPIDAVNDAGSVANGALGGVAVPNVLVNDTLGGTPTTLVDVALTQVSTSHPGVRLDPSTGSVIVDPGTPAGSYTLAYQICERLNPTQCDTASAAVTVAAGATIDAVDNDYRATPVVGGAGGVLPSVLGNDTVNGATPAVAGSNVQLIPGTVGAAPAAGSITMLGDGRIAVAPGTSAGIYVVGYQICALPARVPPVCDSASATLQVSTAANDAVNDSGSVPRGAAGGVAVPDVLANDVLNGVPATLATVVLSQVSSSQPGVTLNPATGAVTVAPGTPPGRGYQLVYRLCERLNPANCDQATVTVDVGESITPQPDASTTTAGTPVLTPVLANDTHLGGSIAPASVTVVTPSPNGSTTVDTATGAIRFVPNPGFTGTAYYGYRVCLAPPAGATCETALVTVLVSAGVDAVDDDLRGTPVNGGDGGTTASVLANDTSNGAPAVVGSNVSLVPGPLATPPAAGSIGLQPDGRIAVAPGTTPGTYVLPYQICVLPAATPALCDSGSATVVVQAPAIAPQPDAVHTGGGSPVTTPVLANDTHTGGRIDPATVTVSTPSPNGSTAVDPATGAITFTPVPGFVGTTSYGYRVCLAAPNGATCGTAVVTVSVGLLNVGKALTAESGSQPGLAEAGETLTFTLTVRNAGSAPVTDYTLVDELGPGLAFASASDGGVNTGQATRWSGRTVPANGSLVLQLAATVVRPVDSASLRNLARGDGDPAPACPGAACVDTPTAAYVTARKRLAAEIGGSEAGLAEFGETLRYTIALANSGGTAASGYRFTEHVPAGATLTAVRGAQGFAGPVAGPATVALTVPSVPARGAVEVGVDFRIADAPPAGLTEIVNLIDGGDLDPACGADCRVATLLEQPTRISILKSVAQREVGIGGLVRYTLRVANVGTVDYRNGTVVDTPPPGFSYVAGSMAVADADNAFALGAGSAPLQIGGIDVPVGGEAVVSYLMRVGAGVRHGVHVNRARALDRRGGTASNIAVAQVTVAADPLLDESLILGTVFHDRDGDGWQDPAHLSDVRLQGGFAPGAYVAGSTTLDRGQGPQPVPDASAPLLHGIALGRIEAYRPGFGTGGPQPLVLRQRLSALAFTDDFVLTSAQGLTVRMDAAGNTRTVRSGDAAARLTAAEPEVTRRVAADGDGHVVEYVVRNLGIAEPGIPGVRVGSVEGLLVETDVHGRFHLIGIDSGHWLRGRNFILKVDPATLPEGASFSTPNPLVRRITPGLPARFDFGVRLPSPPEDPPQRRTP